MTVIQLEGVRERSQHSERRNRRSEPAAHTQRHPVVPIAQPVEQTRPEESVGQEWFGSRDGVPTAQPREQTRPHPSPGLAVRHPEAVYRRRRLVLVSVIGAVLTILLAVGRPETLPGHELPAQEQPIWPTAHAHD